MPRLRAARVIRIWSSSSTQVVRSGVAGCFQCQFKCLGHRLAERRHAVDIDDPVEQPLQAHCLQYTPGVVRIALVKMNFRAGMPAIAARTAGSG